MIYAYQYILRGRGDFFSRDISLAFTSIIDIFYPIFYLFTHSSLYSARSNNANPLSNLMSQIQQEIKERELSAKPVVTVDSQNWLCDCQDLMLQ
jgi:hypothetical protein